MCLVSESLNILEQSWKVPGHWNFWGTVCWTSAGYASSLDPLFAPFNSIRPLSRVWTNDSLLSVHIIINHLKKNFLLKAFPTINICWDLFEFYRWNLIKNILTIGLTLLDVILLIHTILLSFFLRSNQNNLSHENKRKIREKRQLFNTTFSFWMALIYMSMAEKNSGIVWCLDPCKHARVMNFSNLQFGIKRGFSDGDIVLPGRLDCWQ
jgi:hypothetical protein